MKDPRVYVTSRAAALREITRQLNRAIAWPGGKPRKIQDRSGPTRLSRREARTPLHAGTYRRTTCIIESAVSQRAPAELNGRALLALSSESSKVRNGDDQIDGYTSDDDESGFAPRARHERERRKVAGRRKVVREGRMGGGKGNGRSSRVSRRRVITDEQIRLKAPPVADDPSRAFP